MENSTETTTTGTVEIASSRAMVAEYRVTYRIRSGREMSGRWSTDLTVARRTAQKALGQYKPVDIRTETRMVEHEVYADAYAAAYEANWQMLNLIADVERDAENLEYQARQIREYAAMARDGQFERGGRALERMVEESSRIIAAIPSHSHIDTMFRHLRDLDRVRREYERVERKMAEVELAAAEAAMFSAEVNNRGIEAARATLEAARERLASLK